MNKESIGDFSKFSGRKKRRRKTIEELFRTDHYRSIILLTKFFDTGQGLRQLHYRWALIKDNDDIHPQDYRELNAVFRDNISLDQIHGSMGRKLDRYHDERLIIKNSVVSNNTLFNFLKKLVDDYGILKTIEDDKGVLRYRLTQRGSNEATRWHAHQIINWTRPEDLEDFVEVMTKLWEDKEKERLKKFEQKLRRDAKKGKV